MKFAVGYQLPEGNEEPFVDIIRDFQDDIAEVYFPWANMPSGRAPLTERRGYVDWTGQRRLEADLQSLKDMGIKLDLLFNANCYGRHAASEYLQNQVVSVLDHLGELLEGVDIVTTTSPAIAHTVQRHFSEVEVRASVNMRIGTVKGMQYVADLFDSFHVQRDYNRDLRRLQELKNWADDNEKLLIILANSGCMRFCSGQIFHDNMVAHEAAIDETQNIPDWNPHTCWNYLQDPDNRVAILQNTWIRPEDLHNYEHLFDVTKLATRMHSRPRTVISAYVSEEYGGSLLDLFEPGFGPALAPQIIDNRAFPDDWFERTTECDKRCHECNYCDEVLEMVLKRVGA